MSDVSRVLLKIQGGDPTLAGELLPLVYDELRKLAAAKLALEKPGQTLQPTALVHEAYLRLTQNEESHSTGERVHWDGRGHFFAAAAEAMRRILVENARRKARKKHGGDLTRQELQDVPEADLAIKEDILALDAALNDLKQVNEQAYELVKLRYFAGLSLSDSAEVLNVSDRTVGRLWAYARAWLHQEMSGKGDKST
jgi:RNA polymerase sigma factor (TIGR02999 family)